MDVIGQKVFGNTNQSLVRQLINFIISSLEVFLPALILNDPSILSSSSFIADSTWDLSIVPEVHADPLDKAI